MADAQGIHISENWANLLEPGLRTVAYNEYSLGGDIVADLFQTAPSGKATEKDQLVGALGGFEEFTGRVNYKGFDIGYDKTYTHKEFVDGFMIARKLLDDDQYGVFSRSNAQLLGNAAWLKRQSDADSVFANAFTVAYAGGDAVELCDASHPYSSADSGSTQSNVGSSALSHAALLATRTLMKKFTDDQATRLGINPDTIIVPVDLEDTAIRAIMGDRVPGAANWDINTIKGAYKIYVLPFATDTNNWFMVDSRRMKMFLKWFDRIALEITTGVDFDTLAVKVKGYMRYSYGWSNWQFIYGHTL